MSGDEDNGQSRSERLRQRRQSRDDASQTAETEKPSQTSETSEGSKTSKTPEASKISETSKPSASSVKEERIGTYMYLAESQKKDVDRLYNVLKADFEYEYDVEFEKNRHFFPLVVQYGLEGLDGLDASEVKDRLNSI
ncbi:hypothetical protein [Halobacterium salinarum]|uniref:DUF8160 domain-containing protein n=1 Tax=Halobacterium salinarum (strain ATCC 29341 / DSM 671 / R1) TaxID=478009 RepID=B0RA96_HALS3|nr:hypothetical protein [Halobacterium salinarum]UEB93351.1 hypothetical protein LJ422_12110 [Halobacterium salinarum NRC-34001]CAP15723.1 uncharacterized protein OE_8005F [Halobacterium salinarum R1]